MSTVLVIAGSDSSGGAGLTRDVRTLTRLEARALCAITAVTAQSDASFGAVHVLPPELVRAQIAAAFATARIDAIKIGMLATAATVQAVAASLPAEGPPIVLDPVLVSTSGGELLDRGGREALRTLLLPRITVLTPNIPEAAALLGTHCAQGEQELLQQASALRALGAAAVLLKGGHAEEPEATDLLLSGDAKPRWLRAPRIGVVRRGTGCALSAAIAAGLGAGLDLAAACMRAKQHVTQLLQQAD